MRLSDGCHATTLAAIRDLDACLERSGSRIRDLLADPGPVIVLAIKRSATIPRELEIVHVDLSSLPLRVSGEIADFRLRLDQKRRGGVSVIRAKSFGRALALTII